jgi:pyruvate kinase
MLEEVIRSGADVCRLNMAHADHDWVRTMVARVRAAGAKVGRDIPIMMDVKGPEIRTGARTEPLELKTGDVVDMIVDPDAPASEGIPAIPVNYPLLVRDVPEGGLVLVDNGLIQLRVTEKTKERLRCRVEQPGRLGSRRHVNLPGIHVELPSLTEKDRNDVRCGVECGIDFFALSFVRSSSDIDTLRSFLSELGSRARIIAKIEDQSAINNLMDIIDAADALMVARGDLGIEVPYESLPLIQKNAIKLAMTAWKPVIVATHMLESMIENPVPTRAEVTDVSNAVLELTDSIMLSGETTTGKHPLKCIEVMTRIAKKMEGSLPVGFIGHARAKLDANRGAMAHTVFDVAKIQILHAAANLALTLDNAAVIVFTRNGDLPRVLASSRPHGAPVFAFTEDPVILRRMRLSWGVIPFLLPFQEKQVDTIHAAIECLKKEGWAGYGDHLVIMTNAILDGQIIDSVHLHRVE